MQISKWVSNFFKWMSYLIVLFVSIGIFNGVNWILSEDVNKTNSNQMVVISTDNPDQKQLQQKKNDFDMAGFLSKLKEIQLNADKEFYSEEKELNIAILNENDELIITSPNSNEEFATENDTVSEISKEQIQQSEIDAEEGTAEVDGTQNEEILAQQQALEDSKLQLKKQIEYDQLVSTFIEQDDASKLHYLQKIWQLAPEVDIDENLFTLLDLAILNTDVRIETTARKMLLDLKNYSEGILTPDVQLVAQISDINISQQENDNLSETGDDIQSSEQSDLTISDTLDEKIQLRNDKLGQLTQLAMNSEDINQKEYALSNLMQLDHESALEVVKHQFLNSENTIERQKTLDKLNAAIGDINSKDLKKVLEIAANDYQSSIAEYARESINRIDQFETDLIESASANSLMEINDPSPLADAGIVEPLDSEM